jgi:hypothetical protein
MNVKTAIPARVLVALIAWQSIAGCGRREPADAEIAETYPKARELLLGIRVPNAKGLKQEVVESNPETQAVEVRFEGGHSVWVDRKEGTPTKYVWRGKKATAAIFLPLYEGTLAVEEFGHDPLERALQDVLKVELDLPESLRGSSSYEYLANGLPVFELPGISINVDDAQTVTKIENMSSIRIEKTEHKISKQQAIDSAKSSLFDHTGGSLKHLVHPPVLGYAKVSDDELPLVVRLAWRVPIGTDGSAWDFYIDAENSNLIDAFAASSKGRTSFRDIWTDARKN